MLTNQNKLHDFFRKQKLTSKDKVDVLKIIKNGHYDYPDVAFQYTFQLLQEGSNNKDRFVNVDLLIHSALQLKIRTEKITGYLMNFIKGIGETPYLRKLTAFIKFVTASEPTTEVFEPLIKEDQTDYDSKKRALTIHKRGGHIDDYVKGINKYLKENPNDVEAWIELGEIYTEKSHYLRALFCYEEIIILNPDNDYYFIRLAQLYYTHGGKSNVHIAVKYYSFAIGRNCKNVRALWGLYRALNLLAIGENLSESEVELKEKAKDSLHKLYSQKNPDLKIHAAF